MQNTYSIPPSYFFRFVDASNGNCWKMGFVNADFIRHLHHRISIFHTVPIDNLRQTNHPTQRKFISKGGIENNYIPMIVQIAVLTVPTAIAYPLQTIFGENATYIIMATIGIVFIATSKIWLRNIYNRFMKRRYTNLEHFRATR